MSCELYREALSADLDGEETPVAEVSMAEHLALCDDCRTFASGITSLRRRTAVRLAEAVPDLTARILDAARPSPVDQAVGRVATAGVPPRPHWARFALLAVALTQFLLALGPVLFSARSASSTHLHHELGAWDLALAGALLLVVVRPRYAAGLLPFAATLAAAMVLSAVVDVASGRAAAVNESQHLLELAGLGLLWVISRVPFDAEPFLSGLRRPRTIAA